MSNLLRILGSRLARAACGVGLLAALSAVAACGQRGPLYLPTEPAAAHRATLPQVLIPGLQRDGAAAKPDADPDKASSSKPPSSTTPGTDGAETPQ
ncbi:MAG: lipoprotein [Pseudomonas sp.]